MSDIKEKAISLQEAANRLGVHYQTVYRRRHQIAFRLPDSRIWRVWPSTIAKLGKKRQNVYCLSLHVDNEQENLKCHYSSAKTPLSGGLISGQKAAKELDEALAQPSKAKLKSFMTKLKQNSGEKKS
jgi:hypothetical protein